MTIKINRIAANQTELNVHDVVTVFFSYDTPVAAHVPGQGYLRTEEKYSKTTTKHVNAWLKGIKHTLVPQWRIDALVRS